MAIYPSSKVLPYVYMGIHKITGKIYIGSRSNKKQKLPPHLDLPRYRTSSKIVKPIFEEFEWYIVAEFFDPKDAYDFEQQLIHEQWQVSKEMSYNRVCHHGKKSFSMIGKCDPKSEEHNKKVGDALRGKPKPTRLEEHNRKVGDALRGIPKSEEHCKNIGKSLKGRTQSKSHIRNNSNIIDVLTPDGFVIENTTMKELCSQFNLKYGSLRIYFKNNKSYKGFTKI